MILLADGPVYLLANVTAVSNAMRSYIVPIMITLSSLASLVCTFFLVNGGIRYATSKGNPERLNDAKKIIRNGLVGLVIVLAAITLTGVLGRAYSGPTSQANPQKFSLQPIEVSKTDNGLVDVLINAILGLLSNVVQSVGQPFVRALSYFVNSTPLMGENPSVFNLWLAIVAITDVMFILTIALLGFHVMSFSTLGLEELDVKRLLPQLVIVFLLANTSIFLIDAVISLSNAMIRALQSGFPSTDIWATLADILKRSSDLTVAVLLVMIAFLVLAVMLLVYYVSRLIALYVGAILSPLVLLLWLMPAFKDFVITALKAYLATVFVIFVHVVILLLASSIFTEILDNPNSKQNTLMALIIGLATMVALLKTQGLMQELSYVASIPQAAREMSGSFIRGLSYVNQDTPSRMNSMRSLSAGRNMSTPNKTRVHLSATNEPSGAHKSPKSSQMIKTKKLESASGGRK